jgi:hypothetical protein
VLLLELITLSRLVLPALLEQVVVMLEMVVTQHLALLLLMVVVLEKMVLFRVVLHKLAVLVVVGQLLMQELVLLEIRQTLHLLKVIAEVME